jgi:hypothetical protein
MIMSILDCAYCLIFMIHIYLFDRNSKKMIENDESINPNKFTVIVKDFPSSVKDPDIIKNFLS